MKTYQALLLVITIVLVISVVCVWFVPSLQDFMAGNTMWNGIRDFLAETGAETVDLVPAGTGLSESAALVVIPYLPYTGEAKARLKDFIESGGTLVLMDDYGYGNDILEYLEVKARFAGVPLLDPLFCYRHQWLPRITDFPTAVSSGESLVVLNHATALTDTEGMQILAQSSLNSYLDWNQNEGRNEDEPPGPYPVAAAMSYGRGVLVLASDPSLMINSMVNRDDNFAFVRSLLAFKGEPGKIMLDVAHLTKTPLDVSKSGLIAVQQVLAAPFPLLAIVSVIFIGIARALLRLGGPIGRQS